jgi:hypothetical protein
MGLNLHSGRVGYNYAYLYSYFRKETGLPIEEFYPEKKNEKVRLKEPTWSDVFNPLWQSVQESIIF